MVHKVVALLGLAAIVGVIAAVFLRPAAGALPPGGVLDDFPKTFVGDFVVGIPELKLSFKLNRKDPSVAIVVYLIFPSGTRTTGSPQFLINGVFVEGIPPQLRLGANQVFRVVYQVRDRDTDIQTGDEIIVTGQVDLDFNLRVDSVRIQLAPTV